MDKIPVLFLSEERSSSGLIAAALLRDMGGDLFDVATGSVHPTEPDAALVHELAQEGIELEGLPASRISELEGRSFRYVLSLHENNTGESPLLLSSPTPMNWNLVDTWATEESDADKRDMLRQAVGQLRRRLAYFVAVASRAVR